jgi:type II secretory pathway pseudopilin PulG
MIVVVVILGILMGIAVVAYGSFISYSDTQRANANLDRVMQIEQGLSRSWGGYSSWPPDLTDVGSDLTILNGSVSSSATQVSLSVGSNGSLGMAVLIGPGNCDFRLVGPLVTGANSVTESIPGNATCTAQSAFTGSELPIAQTASVKNNGD